jgi:hypothetical protein
MRSHRTFVFAAGAAALLALAACGTSTPSASSGSGSGGSSASSGSSAGSNGPTLSIVSPATGASVTAPFMLKVSSDETIGAPSTGDDHLHVFIDGSSSYKVMTSDQMKITGLSKGQHTILVTLQHADHSPVGPKATVTVDVTKGTSSSSSTGTGTGSGGSSGGYGY